MARHDRSIRRQLRLFVVATTGVALGVAALALGAYQTWSYRGETVREVATLAAVVGANSAAALLFDDAVAGAETLAALDASPGVLAAVLYRESGEVFASWARAGAASGPPPAAQTSGERFQTGRLLVFRPVQHEGETVGSLFIATDTRAMWSQLRRQAGILAALFLGCTFLASVVSSRLQRQITQPISELVEGSASIAQGDLTVSVARDRNDELGVLAQAIGEMAERLRLLIGRIRASAVDLSGAVDGLGGSSERLLAEARSQARAVLESGEAVERITESVRDVSRTMEALAREGRSTTESVHAMDDATGRMAALLETLAGTIDTSSSAISQLIASIGSISESLGELQEVTRSSAAAVGDLRGSVEGVRRNSVRSREMSERAAGEARHGMEAVSQTIGGMEEIRSSFDAIAKIVSELASKSRAIGEVVDVINPVAAETSLLSLNARIIAAQAGEHGRAFSVVAQQVSGLADRTASSARQIEALIEGVQEQIGGAVRAVQQGSATVAAGVERSNEAGRVLQGLLESAEESSQLVREIVDASADQVRDLGTVDEAMAACQATVDRIRHAIEEQQNASGEIATAVEEMRELGGSAAEASRSQLSSSRSITRAVEEVMGMIDRVLEATRLQASDGATLENSLDVFKRAATASAGGAEEMQRVVTLLTERARELEREVARFRV